MGRRGRSSLSLSRMETSLSSAPAGVEWSSMRTALAWEIWCRLNTPMSRLVQPPSIRYSESLSRKKSIGLHRPPHLTTKSILESATRTPTFDSLSKVVSRRIICSAQSIHWSLSSNPWRAWKDRRSTSVVLLAKCVLSKPSTGVTERRCPGWTLSSSTELEN